MKDNKMKKFLELFKSFCSFFKAKPKQDYPKQAIEFTEFRGKPQYFYSIGHGGSGGIDGKTVTATVDEGEIGGPGISNDHRVTVETQMNAHKEFFKDLELDAATNRVKKTKKRYKTKKSVVESNTADILEILKWTDRLTARQLQKASHVRRDRFLPILNKLVRNGKVIRSGTGKRLDPYFYKLTKTKGVKRK